MIYIGIIVAIFLTDFFIKKRMERTLIEGEETKRLGGLIKLNLHHNRGAFLNAGQGKRKAVAFISVMLTLFLTVVFVLTLGRKGNAPLKTGLALLLGGAFSNTYDRLKRKYVVDYLSFNVRWKRFSGIIFNLSDFGIIIGALIAALSAGKS